MFVRLLFHDDGCLLVAAIVVVVVSIPFCFCLFKAVCESIWRSNISLTRESQYTFVHIARETMQVTIELGHNWVISNQNSTCSLISTRIRFLIYRIWFPLHATMDSWIPITISSLNHNLIKLRLRCNSSNLLCGNALVNTSATWSLIEMNLTSSSFLLTRSLMKW
jgi:hypothetical protein